MHRKCFRCQKTFPATVEFFFRDHSRLLGLSYDCKTCHTKQRSLKDRSDRWRKLTPEQKRKVYDRQNRYYAKGKGRAIALVIAYKKVDAARGLTCDLTPKWMLENILSKPCAYCGTEEDRRGADRIDNSIGHLKTNVVPACLLCNGSRMAKFSYAEMLEIGKAVALVRLMRKGTCPTEVGSEHNLSA